MGFITRESKAKMPDGYLYIKEWIPEQRLSKTPLIMLHDSLGCIGLWRSFPELLARKLSRHVIAYDRLGFGQSSARHNLPSINFIKEEAHTFFPAVKKHCSIQKYMLLGHSVGGGMSLNIAATDKDCMGVVSIAAQAFVESITIKGIKDAEEMFKKPGQIDRLKKWHGDKGQWVLNAWTGVWLSPDFAQWSLAYCIKSITSPVLIIHGENDEYGSNAFPDYIEDNVTSVTTKNILKGCGHMPHNEKTDEVVDSIIRFINKANIE